MSAAEIHGASLLVSLAHPAERDAGEAGSAPDYVETEHIGGLCPAPDRTSEFQKSACNAGAIHRHLFQMPQQIRDADRQQRWQRYDRFGRTLPLGRGLLNDRKVPDSAYRGSPNNVCFRETVTSAWVSER